MTASTICAPMKATAAGSTPAIRVSTASVMLSPRFVVHTSASARLPYANRPNRPRRKLPGSVTGACAESACLGAGRGAKVLLLHQPQAEGITVRRAVAHADGGDDDQDEVHHPQNPQKHETDEHNGEHDEQ